MRQAKSRWIFRHPGGQWIRSEGKSFAIYKESNTSLTYLIERPATGRWVMRISPGNQQTVPEDYCITAHLVKMKSADQYTARFSGLFSDNVKDEDKDGIDDHIAIEASVSVKAAGKYSAMGVLVNVQNGEKIRINNGAFLNIGAHNIRFDLFDLKSPGPYRIESLSLYDESGKEIDKFVGDYRILPLTYNFNGAHYHAYRIWLVFMAKPGVNRNTLYN
jgi:hypothetical protein